MIEMCNNKMMRRFGKSSFVFDLIFCWNSWEFRCWFLEIRHFFRGDWFFSRKPMIFYRILWFFWLFGHFSSKFIELKWSCRIFLSEDNRFRLWNQFRAYRQYQIKSVEGKTWNFVIKSVFHLHSLSEHCHNSLTTTLWIKIH